jgi:hypothetical protein
MANQTIPITLTAGPVPPGFVANGIDALLQAFCIYVSGSIRADVSFFLVTLNDPTNFITDLIFNSTTRALKAWDSGVGRYVTLTQFEIGDIKNSVVGGDRLAVGWVQLDGRAITAIPGINAAQQATLQQLFPGGNLPTVSPSNTQNLPANGSFSGITKPAVAPADGVIGALQFDASYTEAEVEALRDATETLRDSTGSVETQVSQIQDKAEELLASLNNNSNPPIYALMFVGYA